MGKSKMRIVYSSSNRPGIALLGDDLIILSQKLKDFPELHNLVLEHEKKHLEYGYNLWKHFKLDLKDRITLYTNSQLYYQLKQVLNSKSRTEQIKDVLFALGYALCSFLIALVTTPLQIGMDIYLFFKNRRRRNKNWA